MEKYFIVDNNTQTITNIIACDPLETGSIKESLDLSSNSLYLSTHIDNQGAGNYFSTSSLTAIPKPTWAWDDTHTSTSGSGTFTHRIYFSSNIQDITNLRIDWGLSSIPDSGQDNYIIENKVINNSTASFDLRITDSAKDDRQVSLWVDFDDIILEDGWTFDTKQDNYNYQHNFAFML